MSQQVYRGIGQEGAPDLESQAESLRFQDPHQIIEEDHNPQKSQEVWKAHPCMACIFSTSHKRAWR